MSEEAIIEGIEMAVKNAEPKIKRVCIAQADHGPDIFKVRKIEQGMRIITLLYRKDLLDDYGLHDMAHEVRIKQLEPLFATNGVYEKAFETYMAIKDELLENL